MIVVGAIQDKNIECLRIDYWTPDQHFVPEEIQRESKAETNTVEGYNSWFRHLLTRRRGKMKCDSQSQIMPQYCVIFLILKWNNGNRRNFIITMHFNFVFCIIIRIWNNSIERFYSKTKRAINQISKITYQLRIYFCSKLIPIKIEIIL